MASTGLNDQPIIDNHTFDKSATLHNFNMYLTCGSHTLPSDVVDRIAAFLETTEEHPIFRAFGEVSFGVRQTCQAPVALLRAFFDRVVVHFETHRHEVPPPELTTSEERHEWYCSRPAAPSKAVKIAMEQRATWLSRLHGASAVEARVCTELWHCPTRPEVPRAVMKWTKKENYRGAKPVLDVNCGGTDVDRRCAFANLWGLQCLFSELTGLPQWKCEVLLPNLPTEANDAEGPYLHSFLITRPHPFFQRTTEDAHIPPVLEAGVDFYEVALQKDIELGVTAKGSKKKPEPKRKPEPKKKPAAKRRKQ